MNGPPRLSLPARLLAAVVGLSLAGLAAVAARLTPDPRGFGTHEQLGAGPCAIRLWTGRPCPTCGMTTAWALVADGRVGDAIAANLGGVALLVAAVATAAWALAAAAIARWPTARPRLKTAVTIGTVWLVVTLLDWARRLAAD